MCGTSIIKILLRTSFKQIADNISTWANFYMEMISLNDIQGNSSTFCPNIDLGLRETIYDFYSSSKNRNTLKIKKINKKCNQIKFFLYLNQWKHCLKKTIKHI